MTAQSMMPQPKSSRADRYSCSSTAAPSTLNTDSMLKSSVTATGLPFFCAVNWSVYAMALEKMPSYKIGMIFSRSCESVGCSRATAAIRLTTDATANWRQLSSVGEQKRT